MLSVDLIYCFWFSIPILLLRSPVTIGSNTGNNGCQAQLKTIQNVIKEITDFPKTTLPVRLKEMK